MKNNFSVSEISGNSTEVYDDTPCTISGVRVDSVNQNQLFDTVLSLVNSQQRATIMYANVHVLNTAWKDAYLQSILNSSDITYCDGAGVVVGARLLGWKLAGRMTGADWIYPFCSQCEATETKIFILAGNKTVADRAAKKLRTLYPGISIVGTHHGFVSNASENNRAIQLINATKPDVVFIGMGTPVQERWIHYNRSSIDAPVVWAVGALFDFVADIQPRGPRWMLDNGLEWVCRFASDPKRLWRRYLLGNPLFLARIGRQMINALQQTKRQPRTSS